MNKWKKIWENRKDTLGNVDAQDYRAVFVELKRIDGFDVNDGPSVESLLRQYENTKAALTVWGGGLTMSLKSAAARARISTFSPVTALKSAGLIIRRR